MQAFIIYCQDDEHHFGELKVHLATLKRENFIENWSDFEIRAGQNISDEIKQKMETEELFLLLVSPDFIESCFCKNELKIAVQRQIKNSALVIPILVKQCDWKSMFVLKNLTILPKNSQPVSMWQNIDEGWTNILPELRQVITDWYIKKSKKSVENPENLRDAILPNINKLPEPSAKGLEFALNEYIFPSLQLNEIREKFQYEPLAVSYKEGRDANAVNVVIEYLERQWGKDKNEHSLYERAGFYYIEMEFTRRINFGNKQDELNLGVRDSLIDIIRYCRKSGKYNENFFKAIQDRAPAVAVERIMQN